MSKNEEWLEVIVQDDYFHQKWLNTLSYMENCGAHKIFASEKKKKQKLTIEVLKHAAEEARHAYFFKRQVFLLSSLATFPASFEDYAASSLFSPLKSKNYIPQLEVMVCKALQEREITGEKYYEGAYTLTTWLVEVRAMMLYECYEKILKKYQSKVSVKSVINEERHHLAEMEAELSGGFLNFPLENKMRHDLLAGEQNLFQKWQFSIEQELKLV